ncbi:uncharacterized protein LOC142465569 isoform X3 [Ascaphus truei]
MKKGSPPSGLLTLPILDVKCGTKEGNLYKDKLDGGSRGMCILSDGDWFTPNGFQEYGGRKKCKNWKKSITCESFPLQQLLEDYSTLSGGSGKHSVPIINPHLGNSARRPSSNPVRKQTSYIGILPPVSSTSSDLLSPPSLLVSCGAVTGILHKNRLAQGNCGKCIRTPQIWCTPEEFLALGGVTDPSTWKGQIYVRGEPLCTLFQKNILKLHETGCHCDICADHASLQQQNDDECSVCGDGGDLTCCEECPRSFHVECHVPSIQHMESSSAFWICTFCKMRRSREQRESLEHQQLLSCQYFLLHVLCDPNNEMSATQTQPLQWEDLKQKLHRMEDGNPAHSWDFFSDVIVAVLETHPPKAKSRINDLLQKEYSQLPPFCTMPVLPDSASRGSDVL